jgi:hypothetical protein
MFHDSTTLVTEQQQEEPSHHSDIITPELTTLDMMADANTVEELTLDAKELIDVILPRFQDRPCLYNRLSQMIQSLYKQADKLSPSKHVPQASFVIYLPTTSSSLSSSSSKNQQDERYQDAQHLDEVLLFLSQKLRPTNQERLASLQGQLHEQVQEMQQAKQATAMAEQKELQSEVDTLEYLLQTFDVFLKQQPHVYNWIVLQIGRLQKEIYELQQLVNQQQPSYYLLGLLGISSLSSSSPPRSRYSLLPEPNPMTAQDRWMDVVLLDELLDLLHVANSPAQEVLQKFKRQCQSEAQGMQKKEANRRHYHHRTPSLVMEEHPTYPTFGQEIALQL